MYILQPKMKIFIQILDFLSVFGFRKLSQITQKSLKELSGRIFESNALRYLKKLN